MDIATCPSREGFNHIVDNKQVYLHVIHAPDGLCSCAITNYGARIVSLSVPDMAGFLTDVALGYNTLEEYMRQPEEYMGSVLGRCANRIAAGLFVLDGHTYALRANNNHNTLHGGFQGLHAQVWTVLQATDDLLVLGYRSVDGEEGFPGTVDIEVRYQWTDNKRLQIAYYAVTDKATLVNLSNHTYFNLSGEGTNTVLDHEMQISADSITPVDETLIPTGKFTPVSNTAFDFTSRRVIGEAIEKRHKQLDVAGGYDHNFVLNSDCPSLTIRSPQTGITMRITTDRPGMQVYTGNYLRGDRSGKSGKAYLRRSAIVLEPQGFPDAIHHPQFPSVVLRPGEVFRSTSQYQFTA